MSAIVTDQFRIANANNFIESVLSNDDSLLCIFRTFKSRNNGTPVGFGRTLHGMNTPSVPPSPLIINSI